MLKYLCWQCFLNINQNLAKIGTKKKTILSEIAWEGPSKLPKIAWKEPNSVHKREGCLHSGVSGPRWTPAHGRRTPKVGVRPPKQQTSWSLCVCVCHISCRTRSECDQVPPLPLGSRILWLQWRAGATRLSHIFVVTFLCRNATAGRFGSRKWRLKISSELMSSGTISKIPHKLVFEVIG